MSDQRYHLLEKLESGGMAEVFLGEATSVQGFKKRVAIKRVLPHLASHTNFIGMFLDEARLGARLTHANIVSVFDIGKSDNSFFIVMEFVDGTNLKKIMETLRLKEEVFPLKDVIYIAMETCRGLSYAHELVDDDGHPVELVHRDVSPPNILISKRGEVKVTDFGLAKARTQLERTDPGVVKGKFSYLSPEVATGQNIDQRADIFALGVCLWEMLAGRRLFLGDTDYETVQAVSNADVPSLIGVHPEVDPQFESLILKSLARDPNDRFPSAREFGDALASYLFHHQMKVTSYDIANLVQAALERQKSVPPQPMMIDGMIQEELGRFTSLESDGGVPIDPSTTFAVQADDGTRPLDASDFVDPSSWLRRADGTLVEPACAVNRGARGTADHDLPAARGDPSFYRGGSRDSASRGNPNRCARREERRRLEGGLRRPRCSRACGGRRCNRLVSHAVGRRFALLGILRLTCRSRW
ncbi:MAG: serine/threonine protein kinase [Deltaproteobacteria bacterium]|nr:serine/threonine protein kinase [Deltaproteobacteria bacterium]